MGCQASTLNGTAEPNPLKRQPINHPRNRKAVNPDEITEAITITQNTLNQQQVKFAVSSLHNHQLFGTLNKRELKIIVQEMVVAKPNDSKGYIFRQGDTGTCFFLIMAGSVEAQIDGRKIRVLGKGETFGELALLFRSPRTASILSLSKQCQFLVVKPLLFKKTIKKMRMDEQYKNLQAIEKVPLFSCLTNKQKHALSNTIKIMLFNTGQTIFSEGDDAQALYIISEGHVKISIQGKKDLELHSGDIFGQGSIQSGMKRSGTASALSKVMCSMISRYDIETTLGSSINNLLFYNIKKWALMRSPVFKLLAPAEINNIIIAFQTFMVEDEATISNEQYKGFIICLEGKLNNAEKGTTIYNEQSWINRTYKCQERLVKKGQGYCSYLPFTKASEIFEQFSHKKKLAKYHEKNKQKKQKFNLSSFTYLKKLGQGQFGQVFLVKNMQFGPNLYAIKCLSKQYIKKEELEESVVAEKQILEKIIFPYIVGFVKAFHDKKYIYLVMEYIHGKEMFDVIREVKSMNTEMIRYYFGCLLLSIQYLHSNNIVYRDLKPQNSVVDSQGKVYLIDMGTAKELTSQSFFKTFTIIGTPHYMAPQVFEGNGYSFEVDLWSLGCLLYQFVCFKLPFGDGGENDPYSVYTSIKKTQLTFPKFLKDDRVKKLMSGLLQKDPRKRGEWSFEKIKKCDYLKNYNWTGLLEEQVKGPYIPRQFKDNPLEALHKLEGKDFMKHIYNNNRSYEIEEWNQTI